MGDADATRQPYGLVPAAGSWSNRRRLIRFLVAALTAVTLLWLPRAARAEDLNWEADTTYSVDVEQGLLHVESELVLTNQKPNTRSGDTITQYFFEGIEIYVPELVSNVSITTDGHDLDYSFDLLEDEEFDGFKLATIDFASSLFYQRSTTILVEYDLAGDAPRSDTPFRINSAYVTFGAFSWGDPDQTTLSIVLPTTFDIELHGGDYETSTSEGLVVYTISEFDDPESGFIYVQAWNERALTESRASVGEYGVVVRAWPGDATWERDVIDAVESGLPELAKLVGLDWVPTDDVEIVESQEVSLAGYGGWYLTDEDRIEIGEWVDSHLVLHELSHSWFDETLFAERWITEGLADAFAMAAAENGGLEVSEEIRPGDTHDRPAWADDLNDWLSPAFDELEPDRMEDYGYEASFWVVQQLIDEIGIDRMAVILSAAANDEIAYRGAGEPETVSSRDDWRRFLDLLEEIGGSEQAFALFGVYVTGTDMTARTEAREAYSELDDSGWDTPLYVRSMMGEWNFTTAETRIEEAEAVLETRDSITFNAAELGVEAPSSLEASYEDSKDNLNEAARLADAQLQSSEDVLAARDAVARERGFLTTIGLIGEDAESELTEAVEAFAEDELEVASSEAIEAVLLIDDADEVGQMRVLISAGVLLLLAGMIVTLVILKRRRARSAPG
jgi:hypothetical protein